MLFLYFIICLLFITLGSLTKNFNQAQLFVLPIGLVAVLFQKFAHGQKIRDSGRNSRAPRFLSLCPVENKKERGYSAYGPKRRRKISWKK